METFERIDRHLLLSQELKFQTIKRCAKRYLAETNPVVDTFWTHRRELS